VLVCALQDAGYEVVTAGDGAALHVARERQPNVILLDLVMPVMDGVEVSRRLRADPTTAPLPIIALPPTCTVRWFAAAGRAATAAPGRGTGHTGMPTGDIAHGGGSSTPCQ
jgi:response regulator RpfG family c-di-GMP phosphodiesterase